MGIFVGANDGTEVVGFFVGVVGDTEGFLVVGDCVGAEVGFFVGF